MFLGTHTPRLDDKGRVKLELALATGKKVHDKRATVAERDWKREKARTLRARNR